MSVAFHPDPASVIARQARLGIPRSRPIVFRPAPAIPPAPGAAETAGPVAGDRQSDSAPPARDWLAVATDDPEARLPIRPRTVLACVAVALKISVADIKAKNRLPRSTYARAVCSWLIRRHTKFSFPRIAEFVGLMDHSSIFHCCQRINELIGMENLVMGDDWRDNLAQLAQFDHLPRKDMRPPRSASSSAGERG